MEREDETASVLRALEQSLLDPVIRATPGEVERRLAADFVEIGSSGRRYDRAQVITALAAEEPAAAPEREITDFRLRMLAPHVALVTYAASRRFPDGCEFRSLRSSLWRHGGAGWQMIFHQGTPAAS